MGGKIAKPINLLAKLMQQGVAFLLKKLPKSITRYSLARRLLKKLHSVLSRKINKLAKRMMAFITKKTRVGGKLGRVFKVVLNSRTTRELVSEVVKGGKDVFEGKRLWQNFVNLALGQLQIEVMGCGYLKATRNICRAFAGFVIPISKTVLYHSHSGCGNAGHTIGHCRSTLTPPGAKAPLPAIKFRFVQCYGSKDWAKDQSMGLNEVKARFFSSCDEGVPTKCRAEGTWLLERCKTCCCKYGRKYNHKTSFALTNGGGNCESWYQAVEAIFSASTGFAAKMATLMSDTQKGCFRKTAKACCKT